MLEDGHQEVADVASGAACGLTQKILHLVATGALNAYSRVTRVSSCGVAAPAGSSRGTGRQNVMHPVVQHRVLRICCTVLTRAGQIVCFCLHVL